MLDCPEIYWQGAGFSMKIGVDVPSMLSADSDNWTPEVSMERDYFMCSYVTITPDLAYKEAGKEYDAYTTALNTDCQAIQAKIDALENDTVFGRLQIIREHILNKNISTKNDYNLDASVESGDTDFSPYCTDNFFQLGGRNTLTCEGYAKTFKLFCDRFQIPCVVVKGTGLHNYEINIVQATPTKDGARYQKCSICKEEKTGSRKVTAKVSTSGLKKSVFVYKGKGKVQRPAKADIVVRDENNKVLPESYYTISFRNDSSKNVGIYYVDITLKGKYYKGKISLAYRINPTEPGGLNAVWQKNGNLKVSWSAPNGVAVSGYEIQYSTDKNFSANKPKKLAVSGGKTLAKEIKGLAKKNSYFIRIRAYKDSPDSTPARNLSPSPTATNGFP